MTYDIILPGELRKQVQSAAEKGSKVYVNIEKVYVNNGSVHTGNVHKGNVHNGDVHSGIRQIQMGDEALGSLYAREPINLDKPPEFIPPTRETGNPARRQLEGPRNSYF